MKPRRLDELALEREAHAAARAHGLFLRRRVRHAAYDDTFAVVFELLDARRNTIATCASLTDVLDELEQRRRRRP
jgi:hypothetical protein